MSATDKKERLLVVDDSPDTLEVLRRNLSAQGYHVFTAPGVIEAIDFLKGTPVDLVITDLKMPRVSGLDLVRHVRENLRDTEVMIITGFASIEGAVRAVKMGAEEYLSKPFTDEELLAAVRRALDKLHLRRAAQVEAAEEEGEIPAGFIAESEVMRRIFKDVYRAARTPATILITGESGTGKELIARAIHYGSARASAPFIPVNCGGIPQELFESELFGHVKGAFTGASETRAGFFQTADGGTIFLDEISETSLHLQVKLLRVLQDKEVCMVGADRTRKVDVRIIAATNKDLQSLVKKGAFRDDLFFRLSVITISIPPLRERGDDMILLARHFAAKFAKEAEKPVPVFADGVLKIFRDYYWPGNVRELENITQRLVVMTDGDRIDIPDLPSFMRFSVAKEAGLNRTLSEVEVEYIRNVLAHAGGNKTRAAKILGIDRKTLREKLKSMGSFINKD
jgi:DNA-binding NtrC family response regulator